MAIQAECGTCHFWRVAAEEVDGRGECRCGPPVPAVTDECQACWPRTRASDWCADWKPRPRKS